MINNLRELNNKVNDFVNYVVKTACEHTTSGQYYVSVKNACNAVGMSCEDFLQYIDFVFEELCAREELLEFDFDDKAMDFDLNCALNYCPHYEWCAGDEEIFDCSYEEWLESPTKPVSQPLSLSQMAEVGVGVISFLAEQEEKNLDDLVTNVLCFPGDMAQAVIDTVDIGEREIVSKLEATILENDARLHLGSSGENVEKRTLDEVISSCEDVSKKSAAVVDINQYRNSKEER